MMSHHYRPFSSFEYLDGDGGSNGGPTYGSGDNKVVVRSTSSTSMGNTYSDDVPLPTGGGIGASAFVRTLQQPFDISPPNISNNSLKFPGGGGMAATTLGFPFTSAQWKELERQAMIYKYMMAAVPVPPDLLLPTNFSADPSVIHSPSSLFSSRLSGNKDPDPDPEPGRCKRTDGKKWRCSRDLAPNQKYCERHLHRGRPRSRKPVEVHAARSNATATNNCKRGRLNHSPCLLTPNEFPNQTLSTNCTSPQLLGSTTHPNDRDNSSFLFKEANGGLELGIEGEMVTMGTSDSQWQHLIQTYMGFNSSHACVLQQDDVLEPLGLLSYSDFNDRGDEQQTNECNLFHNPGLLSLEKQSQMDTSRRFIDAWSNENHSTTNRKESSGNSHGHGNLSPSSLTLSMAMAFHGEERNQIQMNDGVKDSENPRGQMDVAWLNDVPWVLPSPGGPLAEVLRPNAVVVGSSSVPPTSTSPSCTGNGNSISPQVTTVSSPSGVLHRTMLSLSDGSVCNSPTIAASTATRENVSFRWLP